MKQIPPDIKSSRTILAASILGANPLHLGAALKDCEATGEVDWVQVDVMDGHFTPNLSFGPAAVAAIANETSLFIDVHMMVTRPKILLEAFAKSGAHLITVHAEADDPPKECLEMIRMLGKKTGIALKPDTPVDEIKPYLSLLDLVLVMTVHPGFAGQNFIAGSGKKIRQAKELLAAHPHVRWLEVDGGIAVPTIPEAVSAGANVLVCGSSLFKDKPSITAPLLRQAASPQRPGGMV